MSSSPAPPTSLSISTPSPTLVYAVKKIFYLTMDGVGSSSNKRGTLLNQRHREGSNYQNSISNIFTNIFAKFISKYFNSGHTRTQVQICNLRVMSNCSFVVTGADILLFDALKIFFVGSIVQINWHDHQKSRIKEKHNFPAKVGQLFLLGKYWKCFLLLQNQVTRWASLIIKRFKGKTRPNYLVKEWKLFSFENFISSLSWPISVSLL